MKNTIYFFVAIIFIAVLMNSCVKESMIPYEEAVDYLEQQNTSPQTKAETETVYYYHESTNLVLQQTLDSRFLDYDSTMHENDNISGYALKISPRSFMEQKRIEQLDGIKVSYIPFGYEPVCLSDDTEVRSFPFIPLPNDSKEVSAQSVIGKANERPNSFELRSPSRIRIPAMYVEWPKEFALPDDLDYEILYLIAKQPDQQRIVYPTRYWLVFRTYDSVLSSNVRLKNLKIRVSKNGSTISEQLTDSQGRIKITTDQASYESEPLTYSITAVSSSPKWTITREITNTTPIHTALGTLSQYYDVYNPVDTIYITLSSLTTEFEIHRAIDYYRNDTHELSGTIESTENSLMIAASDSTSTVYNGVEYWNSATGVANVVIYDNGLNTQNLMGVIFHEIGHARKDYAQEASYYNTSEQILFHESFASFIGYHLSRKYYIAKGYSIPSSDYMTFNNQHRQLWTSGAYSPLFIDLTDTFNQSSYLSFLVDDSISGVPILSIDRLGVFSNSFTDFNTNIAPMVGVYFTQTQLNTMLSYYY